MDHSFGIDSNGPVINDLCKETLAPAGLEPKPVAVEEIISDKKIQQRLSDILAAVGAYECLKVIASQFVIEMSSIRQLACLKCALTWYERPKPIQR